MPPTLFPQANTGYKANLRRAAAFLPDQIGGAKEATVERHSKVGSKLTPDLIAQAQSGLNVIESHPSCEPFDPLGGKCGFKARLKNEPLSNEEIPRYRKTGACYPF